ncbi:hypothetical protein PybrP1_009541 [[Pythium] brassicae (nom. inval.)]|nr:hypothetical protein PybrP1_009541 [[Pythium] brassicae (nom. inval.)]
MASWRTPSPSPLLSPSPASPAQRLRRLSAHERARRASGDATASVLVGAEPDGADLTAYYAFSRRRSSSMSVSVLRDEAGLSGFLEYKKLDGSWRPFLFQTVDFQLMVYRVHPTHQVSVMTADIRKASEIALVQEPGVCKPPNDTRMFRLGINNTVITLRAVSHHAAKYWIEGLQQLKAGQLLEIVGDRPTLESEDDIFRQIDQMSYLREWVPAPSSSPFCWFCLPPLTVSWGQS